MPHSSNDPAVTIPLLPTLDIETTKTVYHTQLGFRTDHYVEENYLIATRDRMEIHFWLTDDVDLPKVSSLYIRGGQIVALYEEFKARGVERLSEFELRPWNMKEFYVWDPHGNLLKFGAIPEEI